MKLLLIICLSLFSFSVFAQDPMYELFETDDKRNEAQTLSAPSNPSLQKPQNSNINELIEIKLELESNIADLQKQLDAINEHIYRLESSQGYSNNNIMDYNNCEDLTMIHTDKMDGKTYRMTSETIMVSDDGGKTGIGINIATDPVRRMLVITITTVGAGYCIDEHNRAQILFRDKKRIDLVHTSKYNCDSEFTAHFGLLTNNKRFLEDLANREIEVMRVWTTDGSVEREFTVDNSQHFMNAMRCLSSDITPPIRSKR